MNPRSLTGPAALAIILLMAFGFTASPALAQGGGWQIQNLPALPSGSTYQITAVSALNASEVWVAGYIDPSDDAFVARSDDGGATWSMVHQTAMINTITRMKFLPGVGFIGGTFGLLKSSVDGGATWNQEQNNVPPPLHNVGPDGHVYGMAVADSTHIWTAGWDGAGAGVIYHRKPERPQPDPQNPNPLTPWWLEWAQSNQGMYGMAAANASVAWSVGYAGAIWKTVDGGDNWAPQTSGTGASLSDVAAVDANTAWAVGDAGTILKTTDGGATWIPQVSYVGVQLLRIAAVNASTAWAVGTYGVILHTTDGGATWAQQFSGTYETLTGVAAVDADTAWVVGGNNTLLATTDGGTGAWAPPTITSVTPGVLGYAPATDVDITVTGTGFRGGNITASVGSNPSFQVTWISETTVIVRAPVYILGRFELTITNEDGQSATLPDAVYYVAQPGINGFSPYHGAAAGGYPITLNGYGFQEVVSASLYVISPDPPYSSTEELPVTVISPTQVQVTVPADASRLTGEGYITLRTAQSQEAYAGVFLLDPPGGPTFAVNSISPTSGGYGTTITITGVGFSPTATVQICGYSPPIVSRTATQIVVTLQTGLIGMCEVQIDNDVSTRLTLYAVFLAGGLPAPTISTINPASGAAGGNTSVTITGTGFDQTGLARVTFGGYQADITSISDTTLVVKTPPHAPGAVDVMVVVIDFNEEPATQPAVAANGFTYSPEKSVWSDFSGDLQRDLLWRHNTLGDVWLWPMNGTARVSETFVQRVADTGWQIRSLGDQTGEGRADLMWRHATTGQLYFWPMNGSTPEAETYAGTVDPAYDIVGAGDFNGDGKSDLLWRHQALGDLWIWLMDGATPLSQVFVARVDPGYVVKGVGDFDANGKADILWHHATQGDVWVWLMNGTARLSETWVATVPDTGYRIAAVADFTGEGKADILWHHAMRGEVWMWPMNGTTRVAQAWIATVPDTGYQVAAAGDLDGDTKADILWHHATRGEVWAWLMDGAARLSETWVATVPDTGYRIIVRDRAWLGDSGSSTGPRSRWRSRLQPRREVLSACAMEVEALASTCTMP